MKPLPKIEATRIVAASRLFKLEEVDLTFSNGERRTFERIGGFRKRSAVMIVPMLDDETVLLVREYGVGVERYELGLPKGLLEEGEDFFEAANREMQEEIGYAANELTLLKTFTTSPGYMRAKMPVILAQQLYPQKKAGDEPEDIEVVPWKLNNLVELFEREDCTEGRSIAALFLVREHLTL